MTDPDLSRPDFRPRQRERTPPCAVGCPNEADVRGWVGLIAQRDRLGLSREQALQDAWKLVVERNPLPATLGRICPHPCEGGCNRHELDGGVRVHLVERMLGDWALERGLPFTAAPRPTTGSVGVIGAGPAGLSAAYQLARRGYAVSLYDRNPEPGGMLRYGIPDYRLPPAVLRAEIGRIFGLGIAFHGRTRIGRDLPLSELRTRHDALFLAIGTQAPRPLELPGAGPDRVVPGITYLRRVKDGDSGPPGDHVVVVGGGNTAVDAARTALRAGSRVTVLYRRDRAEMPGFAEEVEEMLHEGVRLEVLAAPVRYEEDGGGTGRLLVQRMRPGPVDGSGRPRPVPVPGATRWLDCDVVIAAVAQGVDWDELEGLRPAIEGGIPGGRGNDGVWAGGDIFGAGLAVRAVAEGRQAAEQIHAALSGVAPGPNGESGSATPPARVDLALHAPRPPRPSAELAGPVERVAHEPALTDAVLKEAGRCLSCGLCYGCQRCWMYCTSDCFEPVEAPGPGQYYRLSLTNCEACGKCVDVCPTGFLELAGPQDAGAEGSVSLSPVFVSTV